MKFGMMRRVTRDINGNDVYDVDRVRCFSLKTVLLQ